MAHLLDTTTISWILNGNESVAARLDQAIDHGEVYTSVITEGELAFGTSRLGRERRFELEAEIAAMLASLSGSLAVTSSVALAYATIRRELQVKGLSLEINDLWIASIAKDSDLTLVTSDKAFSRISDLTLEDWLEPK